jgi:hypothetical protein
LLSFPESAQPTTEASAVPTAEPEPTDDPSDGPTLPLPPLPSVTITLPGL